MLSKAVERPVSTLVQCCTVHKQNNTRNDYTLNHFKAFIVRQYSIPAYYVMHTEFIITHSISPPLFFTFSHFPGSSMPVDSRLHDVEKSLWLVVHPLLEPVQRRQEPAPVLAVPLCWYLRQVPG